MRRASRMLLRRAMHGLKETRGIKETRYIKETRCIMNDAPKGIMIPVDAKHVKIVGSPNQFYAAVVGISTAKRRITIASLYINETEQYPLVPSPLSLSSYNNLSPSHSASNLFLSSSDVLQLPHLERALFKNPSLKITLLLDHLRSSRAPSSVTIFTALLLLHPERLKISLFHTPNLHGVLKRLVPARFNEGFGLQHMKAYIFDDVTILSGANLNSEYFEKRQDRYIEFRSKPLSDYYHQIISCVSEISWTATASTSITSASATNESLSLKPPAMICSEAFRKSIEAVSEATKRSVETGQSKTYVIPKLQMHSFGIQSDQEFLSHLLTYTSNSHFNSTFSHSHSHSDFNTTSSTQSNWSITICSGYLNFPTYLRDLLLNQNGAVTILTSSPEANGFFYSKGVSRFLPSAYTYLTRLFLERVKEKRNDSKGTGGRESGRECGSVEVREYDRAGWTWHGKGVWIKSIDPSEPYIMVIGSSNYGNRSEKLDLECQCYLVTHNPTLITQIEDNLAFLLKESTRVSLEGLEKKERNVPWLVMIATRLIKWML